ncbi:hypothetical protein Ciccas_008189 [Cichlidogyrus casuarinus]|uniref:Uncharacterized protein n=1 Tax=Cichlidogyrus casuarinus TaxID=1844966 RepID=A0ABD2Q4U5_9PLAT
MNDQIASSRKVASKGPGETVEFYDILFDYVKKYNFPSDIRSKIDFNLLTSADVIESKLKVYNLPTVHDPSDDGSHANGYGDSLMKGPAKKKVNNSVLFSSVFTNATSETQTHHLSTERRTTSCCRLVIAKTLAREGEICLEVEPPGIGIKANAGFRSGVTLDSEKEKTLEEEITWALNTEVIVPAGCKTRADLVISEEQYDGRFRIDTIIEGSISVLTRDKKTNAVVSPVVISELQKGR